MDDRQLDELLNQKYKAAKREKSLRGVLTVLLVLVLLCALVFGWMSFRRMRGDGMKQTPSPAPIPATAVPVPSPTEKPAPTPTVEPAPTPTVEPAPTPTVEPAPTPTAEPAPTPTVEPPFVSTGETEINVGADHDNEPAPQEEAVLILHRITLLWPTSTAVPTQPISVRVRYRDSVVTELTLRPEEAWTADWKDPYPAEELNVDAYFPSGISATVTVVGERIDVNCQVSEDFHETVQSSEAESHRLPQTGLRNWPVFLLLLLGFLFIGKAALLCLMHE